MPADLEELLDEYGIEYITTGKNTSKHYVNVNCDTSGGNCDYDGNFTMGIRRDMTRGYCWWCSQSFPVFDTKERKGIASTLGIPQSIWKQVMQEQDGDLYQEEIIEHEEIKEDSPDVEVPGEELQQVHRDYLIGRGLDPDWLIENYGVKGTTYMPEDFKKAYRIYFPIKHKGKSVSYVGRSYLPDSMNKYNCCEKEDELYFHKHLLFNQWRVTSRKGIIVEGPTDVLNLVFASGNFNVVGTYGTSYKEEQLQEIRRLFDEIFIIYDNEPAAQTKAMKMKSYLESYNVKVTNLCLKGENDPGGLSQEKAKFIVENTIGKEN